ncbi:MAG TPA: FAD-binding oxidoreductase [Streptosporangiaceae bacterium]|nr:FAD-binding oxidoreductase [Streptosporangiaceae bacterium]
MTTEPIPAQLAAACQAVRPATGADAVSGVQPKFVAAPASTQEAAELLRAAADLGWAVVPRGSGSKLHWGAPPLRCDLVIETTRLDQVVEHAAGDLVVTVQAGVSLERLAEVLGTAAQRLALDPPLITPIHPAPPPSTPAPHSIDGPLVSSGQHQWAIGAAQATRTRGTVGGVLATGVAGPLRLRYGSGRDLLIGITVVRADGTIARSGGKVVKNVAGYDLGKLFAGSRGTLGLITEATFRLHPVPAERAYVTVESAAGIQACRLIAMALESPLAPVAAELDWPGAGEPVRAGIALEGDTAGVAERTRLLCGLLAHAAPVVSAEPPPWWGAGPASQQDGSVVQIAFWPGDLGLILAEIRTAAHAAGVDPAVGGSAAGLLTASLPPEADAAAVAAFVTGLRAVLGHGLPGQAGHRLADVPRPMAGAGRHGAGARAGHARPPSPAAVAGDAQQAAGPGQRRAAGGPPARANVVVLHAPAAVGGLIDLFGPVPSLALMRAIKDQFDPGRIMSPGRFAGGI